MMFKYQQKINPFLWFEDRAEEAVDFYVNTFTDSKLDSIHRYRSGPLTGKVFTAAFHLAGQPFYALDGGPCYQYAMMVRGN